MIKTSQKTYQTSDDAPDFVDITGDVAEAIEKSEAKEGQILVYSRHTTAAIVLQEPEELLRSDLKEFLHEKAPKAKEYKHNSAPDHLEDKMPNAHSHCQHILLGPSEIVPFQDGKMLLGTYQRVFLVELDRSRPRTVVFQVIGE
jgi:secondary thiamine-phosphate synthase enzyme